MRASPAPAWALLLLVSAATAAPLIVTPNDTIDAVHAERMSVDGRFAIDAISFGAAAVTLPPSGTTELTEGMTPANAPLRAGDATYTVRLREATADSVPSGLFILELSRDGVAQGRVLLAQNISNPAASEGARVTFDVGTGASTSALFTLILHDAPRGDLQIDLTSGIDATTNYVWKAPDGTAGPSFASTVGMLIHLHITDGEGTSPHDIRVTDADGTVIAGPSPDIANVGDQQTLDWTPTAAGHYHYECRYHSTMTGDVTIS